MDRELNERIAMYRDQKGYTQEQLGLMLGMKTSTYSQLERKGRVDSIILKKLAQIFNVDVRELLYGEIAVDEPPVLNPQPPLRDNAEPKIITSYNTNYFDISVMEMMLIKYFRDLSKEEQQKFVDHINNTVKGNNN